jgi:uncharacterized membrane protein YhaH (DUF805 family)
MSAAPNTSGGGFLNTLELKLNDVFKGMPKLSDSVRETLVRVWPWLALIGGLAQLAAAYWLWRLSRVVSALNDLANSIAAYTGTRVGPSSFDKTMIYLGVVLLLVEAVILLVAFPRLRRREKSGWNLVFLVSLLEVVYAVVSVFVDGRGIGSLVMNLIVAFVGFYLLFQVRDKFKGSAAVRQPATHAAVTSKE